MTDDLYEKIAARYHLIYADWEGSMARQAEALDGIVTADLGAGPHSILDVSCGIGTQSLGLARLGHRVTGSDLSEAAVKRAEREAAQRGLDVTFRVGDLRRCREEHDSPFDVVLCADNSLPHLLSDREILEALVVFCACLRPGGACVLTVRDYDAEDRAAAEMIPFGIRRSNSGRILVFQTREYHGEQYDLAMYFIEEQGDRREVIVGHSRYYAISIDRLLELMEEAGFVNVRRIDGVFFQPVLVGSRGSS